MYISRPSYLASFCFFSYIRKLMSVPSTMCGRVGKWAESNGRILAGYCDLKEGGGMRNMYFIMIVSTLIICHPRYHAPILVYVELKGEECRELSRMKGMEKITWRELQKSGGLS